VRQLRFSLKAPIYCGWAQVGAAVLGVPVKPTIKEVDAEGRVVKTLRRAVLWEVQTPQVLPSLPSSVPLAGASAAPGTHLLIAQGLQPAVSCSHTEACVLQCLSASSLGQC
jgi:hypothetical protein